MKPYHHKRRYWRTGKQTNRSERKSERQKVKRDISREIDRMEPSKKYMNDLKHEIEMMFAKTCYDNELAARETGEAYSCTCPDPYTWSDEKVLDFLGLK